MNLNEYRNTIFIIKDNAKDSILEKLNLEKKLLNIKLITLSELKKNYFFSYTKEALYYIVKKYNVIPEIAQIYLDNLYYIRDIDEEKVAFLNTIKDELEEKNLLKRNTSFKSFLKNKKIVLYNLDGIDNFYKNLFEELKEIAEVECFDEESESTVKPLYKALNKEEEISFVASQTAKLIKSGIDINKIKLANVQKDYYFAIKKTFKNFNIPVEIPVNASVEGTLLIKKFKELFESNISNTMDNLKEYIKDKNDEKLYKKILSIVNEYVWIDDYVEVKDLIFYDISKISPSNVKLKNAVRLIDFPENLILEDEYVFLINFNQGVIPVNSKDEDYLNDRIKALLNMSTSIDLNTKKVRDVQKKIRETKNLIVSYSSHSLTSELYISNAYSQELFMDKQIKLDYDSSNSFNKIKLLSAKDENKKFGTITDELLILNNHYKDEEYCTYENQFTNIDLDKFKKHLNNRLTLSYSSMNTYYQCAFRYYLDNVLKVNKFEDSFATTIGNIFHKILSECFNENYDFDEDWKRVIENSKYEFNVTEKFFLKNLKDELLLIIDTIKNQMEYSSLKKVLYEKEVIVPIDEKLNITFKGFIDKVLYDNFDGMTVAAIIDYKTGNPELSLDNVPYGLDMQLPIYIYLLKKSSKVQNVRIAGFYLQKILNNIDDREKRIESLKLQGYSNSDIDILEKIDSSYNSSQVIKSLKTTNNGFSSYAKVISDREMDILADIIDEKIKEASKEILNGNFKINPKQISDKLVGCKFCKYRDICYIKNADIVKLKKMSKEDFLGGENDAEMD